MKLHNTINEDELLALKELYDRHESKHPRFRLKLLLSVYTGDKLAGKPAGIFLLKLLGVWTSIGENSVQTRLTCHMLSTDERHSETVVLIRDRNKETGQVRCVIKHVSSGFETPRYTDSWLDVLKTLKLPEGHV